MIFIWLFFAALIAAIIMIAWRAVTVTMTPQKKTDYPEWIAMPDISLPSVYKIRRVRLFTLVKIASGEQEKSAANLREAARDLGFRFLKPQTAVALAKSAYSPEKTRQATQTDFEIPETSLLAKLEKSDKIK